MTRLIAHLDMDAFYASVEVRGRPELRGKPVAVVATARRGAVMTANYAARTFGVRSAMPVHHAVARCPELVLIPQRMEVYRAVSAQIQAIYARHTDTTEPLALDEAYLDLSGEGRTLRDAEATARQLQADILEETQLTASAGVSVNKFLAKLGSGMRKPAGLTVIAPHEIDALLGALPVEDFYGVGPVTAGKLRGAGVTSGAELRSRTLDELRAVLGGGKLAPRLHGLARGLDDRPVEAHREAQSIGVERTFDRDLTTVEALRAELPGVLAEVEARLRDRGHAGRTVVVKLRRGDWTPVTRRRTVDRPLRAAAELAPIAAALLTGDLLGGQGARLLGVTVGNLVRAE